MTQSAFAPFVQLHLLTFYPPSNLNRDDQGRPKTAIVGGFERQRVSSQALKRAWRTSDVFKSALDGHLAERTQRIGEVIQDHLLTAGASAAKALEIASEIAGVFGKVKTDPKALTHTEQLAFVSPQERQQALKIADARLAGTADKVLPEQILLAHDTAADIAMFGRMLASNAGFNREAAVAVAHAITTHSVTIEDDYYTAVDDLKPDGDAGAGFIGEAAFGSGVFYLYIVIDRRLLVENLGGDVDLARKTIAALVEAAASIGPRGKVASYASFARTSFMLAESGFAAPRTLASAFVRPVNHILPKPNDLLQASITALRETQDNFAKAYSEDILDSAFMDVGKATGTLSDMLRFCVDGLK